MGLDQFAFIAYTDEGIPPVPGEDFSMDDIGQEDIARWRKHNRLEGWMSKLFYDKHPELSTTPFNCVYLNLSLEDIDKLEKDVLDWALPETGGFFFGDDSYSGEDGYKDYQQEITLRFIDEAKRRLREANELSTSAKLYYSSWW